MAAKSKNRGKSTNSRKKTEQKTAGLYNEIILICVLAVSILLLISNFGLGGLVGNAVSSVMFGIFGWISYLLPVLLFTAIAFLIMNKGNARAYIKAAAALILVLSVCAFLVLITGQYGSDVKLTDYYIQASRHKNAGGFLGGCIAALLCPMIGIAGTYIMLIVVSVICIILITERSLLNPLGKGGRKVYESAVRRRQSAGARAAEKKEQKRIEQKRKEQMTQEEEISSGQGTKRNRKARGSGISFDTTVGDNKSPDVVELFSDGVEEIPEGVEPVVSLFEEDAMVQKEERISADVDADRTKLYGSMTDEGESLTEEETTFAEQAAGKKQTAGRKSSQPAVTAVDIEEVDKEIRAAGERKKKRYKTPPLNLLTKGKKSGGDSDAHLRSTARKLEQTLQNFGVKVHVTNASCGPSVTRYEIQPEQGVKVSKIVGLADDIKLNLAVTDLRIEAPIPGKAAVGIEVPNTENTTVMLRDLLEAPEFQRSSSRITFAVGRDIAGKAVVADIAKMPHLLVAGATGSGKSVCINTLIMSILYKSSPEDVKLIMIDPKVVELSIYNGIPHLMIPVVTDPCKAAGALNWAVAEMTKRYQLFAEYNVRDLKGFNEKVSRLESGEDIPEKLPQIVIIVDELADLMMVAPKDVEGAICRLAQLARAAGLHLILATQRPSVNVITGLIKANMPSRIAFAVSSGVDSRTIIDMNGAEKLLGKGDMLFYPTGYPKPVRVQGSFVSDEEVQKVVDYLISNYGDASYSEELEEHMNNSMVASEGTMISGTEPNTESDRDHFFKDAGMLIIDKEKASIGMLQRMFKIGFNRAARIMDQLAEAGVVGPEEGTKPRKVLMTKEEFENYLNSNT